MLPPGVHTVRSAALDYVGNEGVVAAATFVVDGNPPAAPPQLAAQGASPSPWRSATTYALTWQHPPDVSGIAKAYVKVNGAQPAALGPVTAHTVDLGPNAAQGATPVFVWLEDNVQNTDPNNAAVVELRHDSVVPTITASAPPKATVPPIAVPFTATEAGAGGQTPTASGVKKAVLWSRVVPAEATCAATPGPWTRSEEQAGPGEGVAAFSGAFAFTPPADGRWCFYVQGEDVAGNKTPDPAASAAAHGETLYDGTPPVLRALRVTDVTAKQASLAFESDKPATARVEWGLTAALGNAIPLPEATAFTTDLRGLPSAALIYYKVTLTSRVGRQSSSELRTFATPLDLSFAATIDNVIYPDQPIVIRLDNPSVGQAAYSIGGAAGSIPLSGSFSFFPPAVQGPATLDVIIDGATYSRTFLVDDPSRNFRIPRKVVALGGQESASATSKLLAAAGQPASTGDAPLASDRSRLFLGYLAGIDPVAPGPIADLAAVTGPGRGQVTLNWKAVGDDAGVGKAMVYELRRSAQPIATENDYKNAVSVGVPVYPAAAGTAQTAVVSGLPDGTLLYFALKAVDEVLNRSPLGRVASAATLAFVASAESVGGAPAFELLTSVSGITVHKVEAPGSLPVLRAAAQGFVTGGPLFEVTSPVNPLPTPGLLTLRYDPAAVGAAELSLKAFRFDAELGSWELLADSQLSPDRDLVTATVGHFSYITLLAPDAEAPTTELLTLAGRRYDAPDGQVFLSAGTQLSLSARDPPVGGLPGTGVLRTESRTDGAPSVSRDTAPFSLPEGLHALAYRSFDTAGNSEPLRSAVLRVDAAAPRPALSSPDPSLSAPGGFTVLSTRAADGGLPRVVVSVADLLTSSGAGPGSGVARASVSVDGSPYQAFADSVTLRLGAGRHLLRLAAEDNVGNAAEAGLPAAVGDLAAPRVILAVGSPRAGPFVSGRTVLTWAAEDDLLDPGDGLGSGAARLSVLVDGVSLLEASRVPQRGAALVATATLAGFGDGPHTLLWSASDAFGNVALGSAALHVDSRPPEFLAVAPGAFSSAAVAGLAVSYADAGVGVSSASVLLFVDGVVTAAAAVSTGAQSSLALAPGRHSAAWSVSDLLGQAASTATAFVVDRAAPAVAILAPLGGERFIAGQSAVAVAFGVADALTAPSSTAALVQLADRGAPRGARPDAVLTSSGAVLDPFSLDDGVWQLRVSAVDAAGNSTSAVSGAFEVIHDTLPPRSVLAFGAPSFADAERGLVYVASRTVLTLTSQDDMVQTGDAAGLGVAEQAVLLDGTSTFAFVRPAPSTQTVFASTFSVRGADGPKDLRYGAKDVLGHEEALRLSRIGLDGTAPVLASAFSREPVTRSTGAGAWFPEDFAVVWTATDTGSGLAFVSPASSVTAEGRSIAVFGTAADRLGHAAQASVTVNLDKTAPRVSAGVDIAVTEGSSAAFSGTVSDNLDAAPAFSWLFPDGRVAEGDLAPAAFYPNEGEFAPILRSTDHAGHMASSSVTVRVANAAPRIAAAGDRLIKEGEPLVLTVTFTDPGVLDAHTASVDWGDGRTATMTVTEAGGSGSAQAEHPYEDDGLFSALVTVRDEDGGVSTAAVRVTVLNLPPALATLADQAADEGASVALRGAGFTDGGFLDAHTATVDWGDGTTGTAAVSSQTVSASHSYGDNGAYAVTVTVADDDGGASTQSFTATVGNVAPSLAALANQSAGEGSLVDLRGAAFTDPGFLDTHTATVNWGDGTVEAAAVSSKAVLAQHSYGDNGAYTVLVTVKDDDGASSSRTFLATIANAAPSLAALADQSAAEGSLLSLQGAAFTDPGRLDTHSATVDWGDGTSTAAVVSNGVVQAQHAYGDNGAYRVVVAVRDDEGAVSSGTFTATVGNAAPRLAALAGQSAAEGSVVSLQGATFTDPGFLDTHTATVNWGDGTTEAASISSKAVLARHAYGDNGAYAVTVTVADDDGGTASSTFTATISNVAPDLAALANQAAAEGSPASLPGAAFTDPGFLDTHSAIVNWGDGTSEAAAVSSKTVSAQHVYGDDGAYTVTVTVGDDDGGTSAQRFTMTVANAAPSLAVLAGQTGAEGSAFSLQDATFTDAGFLDTHTATADWGDGTVATAAISSKTLTAQHVYGDNGIYDVIVTVRDDEGAAASRTFKAVVSNAAPALAALGDLSAAEGALLPLKDAVFTDAGALDTHTARVNWGDGTSEPATVSSKTLQAHHAYGDNGAYTVTVTVADDDGGTSSQSFKATIANAAPILAGLADQNAAEGSTLSLQGAAFTDPGVLDTHTATVDWGDGTTAAAVVSNRVVQAQHAYGDNGAYRVVVAVRDDEGAVSSATFTATVGNVAPSLAALAGRSAAEGSVVSLQGATFTDPGFLDSHAAAVNWGDGTTEVAAISSKTVLARHAYGDNGAYTVTVTVSDDDGGTSAQGFTATVSNAPPSLAALAGQGAAEGSAVSLQGAAFTDPGFLDTHTATVDWGDGSTVTATISSKTVQARHAYGDDGTYTAVVTVTDDDGAASSSTFKVTVANTAPALAALPAVAAPEGSFIQLPPASFTDAGYLDTHTAAVDWGDGTSEPAGDIALTRTAGAEGTATSGTIQARHAYGDDGAHTAVVTVTDDDGAVSSSTFKVTVGNAAPALAALPDLTAAEGAFIQLPPAAFTDAGYLDTHGATIDWGDGTSEPAADVALTLVPGREGTATAGSIQARHAYGDNGTYSAVVTVRDDNGATSSSTFKVAVANTAPALAALPAVAAQEGAFIQLPPASFTDAGYLDTHTAAVDWGDGTREPAGDLALTPAPGGEGKATAGTVQARHAYGDDGLFTAVVIVTDDDGAVSSSSFKVTVANAPPVLAALPDAAAVEGAFIQLPPAAFTDAGYLDAHAASIDWGDGTVEPAADVVLLRSAGQEGAPTAGTVQARHAYADNGTYTALITVRDDDGGTVTAPLKVTVANAAPAVAALPDALSGAGGVVYVGGQIPVRVFPAYATRGAGTLTNYAMGPDVVQAFAPAVYSDPGFDNPPGGTREDFTAAVAWGDGQTTSGVAVDETPGSEGLSTVGRAHGAVHRYAANGVYSVTVTVADDDAGSGARAFSVTVDREPPVTRTTFLGAYRLASAAPGAVPPGLDVFLRSNSDIALSADDPRVNDVASGVQRTFWREGQSAPFILYTAPFRTPGAGLHVVEYFSVDERGNEEPHKLLRIGVDDAAPASAVAYGTAAVSAFGLPLLTPDTPVTLSAADLEAAGVAVGLERVAYRLDGGPETAYAAPFMVPAQGTHRLDVLAYDRLGNVFPRTTRFAVAAFSAGGLAGFERVDGSGTADVAGPVLSNGPADFSGSVAVNGDVAAATVTLRGQARVSGAVRQGAAPLHPEPIDLALVAELAAAASANALIPADLLVDGALVMGSGRAHVLTTGTYVLKGLKLDGGASLAIRGRVDILIDGALEVSGGAGLNAAGSADDVNLYVAGASTVSLAGGARLAATVYAPRAAVRVAGNARAAGTLFGRATTVSGLGNVVTNARTLPPEPTTAGGGDKGAKGAKPAAFTAAAAPAAGADSAFALRDLYVFPNPALDGARPTIHLAVGVADKVTIRVFDVSGRPVHQATLDAPPPVIDDGTGPKHAYEHAWDGRIPSGVYFYTVTAEKAGQPAIRRAGKFSVVR